MPFSSPMANVAGEKKRIQQRIWGLGLPLLQIGIPLAILLGGVRTVAQAPTLVAASLSAYPPGARLLARVEMAVAPDAGISEEITRARETVLARLPEVPNGLGRSLLRARQRGCTVRILAGATEGKRLKGLEWRVTPETGAPVIVVDGRHLIALGGTLGLSSYVLILRNTAQAAKTAAVLENEWQRAR